MEERGNWRFWWYWSGDEIDFSQFDRNVWIETMHTSRRWRSIAAKFSNSFGRSVCVVARHARSLRNIATNTKGMKVGKENDITSNCVAENSNTNTHTPQQFKRNYFVFLIRKRFTFARILTSTNTRAARSPCFAIQMDEWCFGMR